MGLCRAATAALGLALVLLRLQLCSATVMSKSKPQIAQGKPSSSPLRKLPHIPGIDVKALLTMYNSNPADAVAAYMECKQHGDACKVPCTSISNCAGCFPGTDSTTVCRLCMPGTVMSADKKSCTPCAVNTFSRGGRATSCQQCPAGQTAKAGAAGCSGGKQGERQGGGSGAGYDCDTTTGSGYTQIVNSYANINNYGCVADLTLYESGLLSDQRCAVRMTENPTHYDACPTSPTYPNPSSTKCTQVSIASAPIPSTCAGGDACPAQDAGCWVQPFGGDRTDQRLDGWIRSGPSCNKDPYGYLAPCPYAKCRTAPSCEECKVQADLLMMREAPCQSAPTVKRHGADVMISRGATFEYLDRNSRQSESCAAYGIADDPQATAAYCWVMGQYKGISGWVPVQKLAKEAGAGSPWASALCEYYNYFDSPVPELLVSDDGSATGCAQLTRVLVDGPACFPADATVTLRGGATVRMSQLALGDEVAVRSSDGSLAWSGVYAFGHRDNSTPSDFVEITSTAAEGGESTTSIQATADHFVLVGSTRPAYKRAGKVVVGDTLWMSVPGCSQLVPAVVTKVHSVANTGLYAPITVSGSIIVNDIAASVHSNWFADSAWSALGLPEAWLPALYQAVLAPVRLLWHILPNYKEIYTRVEQTYGITATVPTLSEFVGILVWVLRDVMGQSGSVLATTATLALVARTASKGLVHVRKCKAAPLFLLMCLSLAAMAAAARNEGAQQSAAGVMTSEVPETVKPLQSKTQKAEYYPGAHSPHYQKVKHEPANGYYKERPSDKPGEYDIEPHYEPRDCRKDSGCCSPPDVELPHGHWDCPYDTMPFGGKCIGVCDGPGFAEVTCTPHGWKHVVGACYKPAVCHFLPTAALGSGAYWPESCRNTLVGDFCTSRCKGPAGCSIFHQAIVRCTLNGWDQTATTAVNPTEGVPLGCVPAEWQHSGPAVVAGIAINTQPRKKPSNPRGKTPLPNRPFRPVMPRRGQQQPGNRQVCDANPPYEPVGPSNTVAQFVVGFVGGYGICTAWFISPNLAVTAGHCVSDGGGSGYALDPYDPGYLCLNPDQDTGECSNDALFLVKAWVTTKGYYNFPYSIGETNDGAVLLVEPFTDSNIEPVPLDTTTFNGEGSSIPSLDIATSGFPCSDDRFAGCNEDQGLNGVCAVLRGYTASQALPILDTNNAVGALLTYQGSSCGGHSGGPLSAPDSGVPGFGILVSGHTFDCSLEGGSSGSTYSQIVDKNQRYGVFVDALVLAIEKATGVDPLPRKHVAAAQPQPRKHTV